MMIAKEKENTEDVGADEDDRDQSIPFFLAVRAESRGTSMPLEWHRIQQKTKTHERPL